MERKRVYECVDRMYHYPLLSWRRANFALLATPIIDHFIGRIRNTFAIVRLSLLAFADLAVH